MQTEFPKLEEFLISLQKSWKEAIKAMDMAKETMKRQFDKKRQNLQGLKEEDNIWLKAKNIHSNRLLKKLGQKRYGKQAIYIRHRWQKIYSVYQKSYEALYKKIWKHKHITSKYF